MESGSDSPESAQNVMKQCLHAIEVVGPDPRIGLDTIDQLSSNEFSLSHQSVQVVIGAIMSAISSTVEQKLFFITQLLECTRYCKAVEKKAKTKKVSVTNLRRISWISWIVSISQSKENATDAAFSEIENLCVLKIGDLLYALSLDKKKVRCLIEH